MVFGSEILRQSVARGRLVHNPKVSILMSVYNEELHLRQAVVSILDKTFSGYEFIIINDVSPDGTGDMLRQFAQIDDRICVHDQEN